jgi:hypothetical protein
MFCCVHCFVNVFFSLLFIVVYIRLLFINHLCVIYWQSLCIGTPCSAVMPEKRTVLEMASIELVTSIPPSPAQLNAC